MKDDDDDIQYSYADLRAAVLAEREACAKVADNIAKAMRRQGEGPTGYILFVEECAVAIRAKDMSTKPQNIDTSTEHVHEIDKSVHEPWDTSDMAHRTGGLSMGQEPELVGVIGNWGRVEWADGVYPQMGDRLYSAPSSKPWVSLTEEESSDIYNAHHNTHGECITSADDLVLDIEAKLKEKNT